ncbi:MAG: thiamine pyrophosphate-dependent enzyme [Defluviicoccus sp.]|nr:thiamine pyrophosphate-dependent enzyme [Defluviicoccus sp.]
MRRDECFRKLAEHRGEAIVVAAYTSAFEWVAIDPSPLNYVSVGAMGQASSHALGLAIGLPDRKIVVLDGDGSLLMNLGSLVTIAEAGPENLVHFVVENGTYEANGGHPTEYDYEMLHSPRMREAFRQAVRPFLGGGDG